MKKILISYIIALITVTLTTGCPSTQQHSTPSPALPTPVNTPTYKVYVKGLVCPSCAVGLKKGLMKLSFIEFIHINYKTGMTLIYEKRQRDKGGEELDKLRIRKAIKDSGYKVDRFTENK